jgi:hypothetical protein
MKRSRWFLLALGALLLAAPPVRDAEAKKPRTFFKALVDGKKFKGAKRTRGGAFASTSFSVYGATKPKRGVVRTIQIVCGPVDLRTVAPGTTLTCYADLTHAGGRASDYRQWSGTAVSVTVDAFDGGRASGSFQGLLEVPGSANPTPAPAVVEGGIFSLPLTDLGI